MNADYIVAALMITTAIVWPITGCLRELRERAEAERVAGEDQAREDFDRHVLDALRAAADGGLIEAPRSSTPIHDDLAVEYLRDALDQWGRR